MRFAAAITALCIGHSSSAFANASPAELSASSAAGRVGAFFAHEQGYTGSGVRIGILDSGLGNGTGEFNGRIVAPYDTNDGSNNSTDTLGHGTKIAGLLGAAANGSGVVGVAPDALLIPVRVYDSANLASSSRVQGGVRHALANGARIINLSLGSRSAPMAETAVREAVAGGALVVAAAGNFGDANPIWPARFASASWANGQVLAVGAVDNSNNIASFSNRAGDTAEFFLVAPGSSLQTTCPSGYCSGSGTSYAAPVVAGAAGLLLGQWSYLTAQQTAAILLETATDLGAPGVDAIYGHGLVNVNRAMQPVGTLVTYTSAGAPGEPAAPSPSIAAPPRPLTKAELKAERKAAKARAKAAQKAAKALAKLQLQASRALANGLAQAADDGLLTVAGFDDYGRHYTYDLGANIGRRDVTLLETLLGEADRGLGIHSVALGRSASLLTYIDSPLVPVQLQDPLLLAGGGQEMRIQATLFETDLGTQRFSAGSGGLANQFFGIGAGESAGWLGQAIANPLVGTLGLHAHAGWETVLGDGRSLRAGLVSGRDPLAGHLGLRNENNRLWIAELHQQFGNTRIAVGTSLLDETAGVLGSSGSLLGASRSGALQLAVSHTLSDRLSIAAQYSTVRNHGEASDTVLSAGRIIASSWGVGLVASAVLQSDDRLSLALSQPLAATSGHLLLDASTGVAADGTPVQSVRRIALDGERPLRAELRYSVPLADTGALSLALVHQRDAIGSESAAMVRLNQRF